MLKEIHKMIDIQGWINLYKPKNISSFKAINKIKKKFSINKIGHAGTLDPLAEGILPIAIGSATKLISFINSDTKFYNFTINWTSQTTTDDCEGKILFKSNSVPKIEKIEEKIAKYIGFTNQIPPNASAIKVNGKRAYKLLRQNIKFNLKPKEVFIKKIKIINHKKFETSFKIECGKGFYIRSFARDLAIDLKTFGHISSLERVKVGKFDKVSSILLDDLLKIGQRQAGINWIKPTISMLDDILAYEIVDQKDLIDLSFGRSIKINEKKLFKPQSISQDKKLIFLSKKGDIVSFGKLIGSLFVPQKVLL